MQYFKNIQNRFIKLFFLGPINKLSSFIKVYKDPLSPLSHSNVVYKLYCIASYVGQTRRLIKTKIDEHRSHIRRNTNSKFCYY